MKYSIIGRINNVTEEDSTSTSIINKINTYTPIWRFALFYRKGINGASILNFEIWLDTITNKTNLFNDLKIFVDQNTGELTWHECSHDEIVSQPCVIQESYSKSG